MDEDLVGQLVVGRAMMLEVKESPFQMAWMALKSIIRGRAFKHWSMEITCRVVAVDSPEGADAS